MPTMALVLFNSMPVNGDIFCQGTGSTMNRYGFGVSLNNPERGCVILLYEDLVLDTEGKFIGAMLGVLGFALLSEILGYANMRMHNSLGDDKPLSKQIFLSVLYALQGLHGFVLMLIVMTFSVELIFAVLFGLGLGYVLSTHLLGNN